MKAYTDIERSKVLAKILPLESADMFYNEEPDESYPKDIVDTKYPMVIREGQKCCLEEYGIPCWSLAALLGVLPSRLFDSTQKRKELYLLPDLDKSYCFYRQFAVKTKGRIYLLTEGECLVDACVAMILKLHELNLL